MIASPWLGPPTLAGGGEDVRGVQLYPHPEAEAPLDWFHVTLRMTVRKQIARARRGKVDEGEDR